MNAAQEAFSARQKLVQEVNAFLIWREGKPVDWRCTARELADATGLSSATVRRICAARGWPIQPGDYAGNAALSHEPETLMSLFAKRGGRGERKPRRPSDRTSATCVGNESEELEHDDETFPSGD